MSRSFTPTNFVRRANKTLLKEHLIRHGLAGSAQWADDKPSSHEPLMQALHKAPEAKQAQVYAEWRRIHEQGDEPGMQSILSASELTSQADVIRNLIASGSGPLEVSLHTFLYLRQAFDTARKIEFADHILFQKRKDIPLEHFPGGDDEARLRLECNLSDYFRASAERGHGCVVDAFQRDHRFYYFCYLEDHPQTDQSFSLDHKLINEPRKPAFEVIFILNTRDKTLETRAKGGKRVRAEVDTVFGRSVLKFDLCEPPEVGQIYNLNLLLRPEFNLPLPPDCEVHTAIVTSLRVRLLGMGGTVTIDVPATSHENHCYNLFSDIVLHQVNPNILQVVSASFRLGFNSRDGEKSRRLAFTVGHPASCSLRADPMHETAKELLQQWGIDVTKSPSYTSSQPRSSGQYRLWF